MDARNCVARLKIHAISIEGTDSVAIFEIHQRTCCLIVILVVSSAMGDVGIYRWEII